MSSIKLKHSSGNSMSIAAPATNPASDLSLKLPATIGSAGQVLQNSSTAGTLEFANAGKVLQAVTDVDEGSMTTNSTSWQWQGLDVTITPSSTSSRILLLCTLGMDGSSNIAFITLYRGTDNLGSSEGFAGAQHPARCISGLTYLDSPSSTSALQYRIAVRNSDNSTTVECPPWANGHQTLTALEIAG